MKISTVDTKCDYKVQILVTVECVQRTYIHGPVKLLLFQLLLTIINTMQTNHTQLFDVLCQYNKTAVLGAVDSSVPCRAN